ncbi:MAG: hypothetical protein ACHQXA_06125 [Gemmatimonadales bacterium]
MLHRPLVLAGLALLSAGPLAAQQTPDLGPYLMTDRAAEVALARSAAPKEISDNAAVLVLTRTGYVEAAKGTNGYTCFVQHSFDGPLSDPGFWDPAIRAPECANPPASRTVLPIMKKRAEWIMTGVTPKEIAERTRKAYASHEMVPPEAGSMIFMLSPEQHLSNTNPHWMPHVMFLYDKSMPAATMGVDSVTNTVIDGSVGDPDAPFLLVFIPVRRWSDGTLALPMGTK